MTSPELAARIHQRLQRGAYDLPRVMDDVAKRILAAGDLESREEGPYRSGCRDAHLGSPPE